MLHKQRIVRNTRCPSDHHPKSFDLIDQLFPIKYFQRMSCMHLLGRNSSYRFRIVPMLQEYIHRLGSRIALHHWVYLVLS